MNQKKHHKIYKIINIAQWAEAMTGFIMLYLSFALLLSWIPVNANVPDEKGVTVFIRSNGVHTDIVLPVNTTYKDWTSEIDPLLTKSKDTDVNYIAFGWGDKGFYLETETWADLQFSTAFKAMFFLGSSAIHVSFYKQLKESAYCKKINIPAGRYVKLVKYIENSFLRNDDGGLRLINDQSYGNNDLFYDARRTYSLFYTCNTWANEGLKQSGLKACLWTPFDKGILFQYR